MTATETFIRDAIEGRYRGFPKDTKVIEMDASFVTLARPSSEVAVTISIHEILLDPEAWKAVGKVRGWDDDEIYSHFMGMFEMFWKKVSIAQYLESIK